MQINLQSVIQNEKDMKRILEIQSTFPYYSLANQILLFQQERERQMKQKEVLNITMLQGESRWRQLGQKIKEGMEAFRLRVPFLRKENGKVIVSEPKEVKVYDTSQLQEPKLTASAKLDAESLYEKLKTHIATKTNIHVLESELFKYAHNGEIDRYERVNDIEQRKKSHEIVIPKNLEKEDKFREILSQYIQVQCKQSDHVYLKEHEKTLEQAVKYVVAKHYQLPNPEVDFDQVIRATKDIESTKNFLPEMHRISQKTIDVCNQLSNELKLENKIEQFKEALQEVIRKHDFREVTTYSELIRPISGNLEIPDGKALMITADTMKKAGLICDRSVNGELSIGLYTKEQQAVFQKLEQKYGPMDLRKNEVKLEVYNKEMGQKEKVFLRRDHNEWYLQVNGGVGSPKNLLDSCYTKEPVKNRTVKKEQELTLER
ncbi:hypothetical protein [Bacillus paramycoides]|uniref:hypothetical protein n=1 Tax=Bacillus paramycoides TaxID=2026194 RepID=UPI002E1DE168|nr:hypothetical protein [Bacillus paramycoides]